jgi:hypothetical protein
MGACCQIVYYLRQATYADSWKVVAYLIQSCLVLFGDNAYINTPQYMVTPFTNVSSGGEDDYNFYHSQVRYCPT